MVNSLRTEGRGKKENREKVRPPHNTRKFRSSDILHSSIDILSSGARRFSHPLGGSFLAILLLAGSLSAQPLDCSRCHTEAMPGTLPRPAGIFQKAVGVLDKGQVQNNTSNFGNIASFHVWFTNALHWPRTADGNRQYGFGLGLLVGIDEHNVIETETQTGSRITDWLPPDDALGRDYSGEVRAVSDDTPFQASSDLPASWPDGTWPGTFRVDVNALSDSILDLHPDALSLADARGQFVSDRDAFATYNDAGNPAGSYGITVEQTGYSYGRPYAEDIQFYELRIYNDGGVDLQDLRVGLYSKFRPDYDNHDYLQFVDSDGDGVRDLVTIYDLNNQADGAWTETNDPLGMVGLRVYDTPGDLGITDFHHFARAASPSTDEEFWALLTSDPTSSALVDPVYYFHGDDPHLDYTGTDSLLQFYPPYAENHGEDEREGNAINTIIGCGPFDLPAGTYVTLSFGLILGDAGDLPNAPDTTDLMANVRTANQMYRLYFQGSGPPAAPTVHGTPGDGRVTLFWDGKAEQSEDVWTGEQDFEGYKIYRSTDNGQSWGEVITDFEGIPVGYKPIAILDYSEEEDLERFGMEISGQDPAFPQSLGENRGIAHSYVDSNLINGVEYMYCVTAFDRGNQDPDNLLASLSNALGASDLESHTVVVTPGRRAPDLIYGLLEPEGDICDGQVRLEIEDPAQVPDHEYELTFDDAVPILDADGDTVSATGATLVDLTLGDTLVHDLIIGQDTDTNLVALDGFLLHLQDAPGGARFAGWTRVAADTCTFEWLLESKWPELVPSGQAVGQTIETYDDWRITVDTSGGLEAAWYDVFVGDYQPETQHLPLRVEVITDPDHPEDVSDQTSLAEYALLAPDEFRISFYSPKGWDLEPGGLGYLAGSPGWYEKHVDFLILEKLDTTATGDTLPNYLFLFTNNKPDSSINRDLELEVIDAHAPSDGDQFTILTYKPFRPTVRYRFAPLRSTAAGESAEGPLNRVRVVPDPYVVGNVWERSEFGKRLMFNNLPSRCTIRIYTLIGEQIATVEHGSDTPTSEGYAFWDMRTRNDQFIAPGVYLYHIETPAGDETVGRFLVIK